MTEIEVLLKEDEKEKKRIGYNVYHRASRTGKIYSVKLQNDKKRSLNGKVITYSMDILPLEDFNNLIAEEKKKSIIFWIDQYGIQKTHRTMGISRSNLYFIIKELGITLEKNKGKRLPLTKQTNEKKKMKEKNFSIIIEEEYDSEKLSKKLLKLATLFEGENIKYQVSIVIKEIKE